MTGRFGLSLFFLYTFLVVWGGSVLAADDVRVTVPEVGVAHLAVYVAKQSGFFRDEGIDADIVRVPAHIGIQALLSGDSAFFTAGGTPIRARMRGAPVRVIGAMLERPVYVLYARPSIRAVQDLRGKSIGVPQVGSLIDTLTNIVLQKRGIKPGEVVYRPLGGSEQRFQAMRAGLVDATALAPPFTFLAKQEGYVELVPYAEEVSFTAASIATTEKVIKDSPALIRRFMIGAIRALSFVRSRRADTAGLLMKWTGIDKETALKTYDAAAPYFSRTAVQDRASMAADLEIQKAVYKITNDIPLEQIFDFSFAVAAGKELEARSHTAIK